MKGLVISGKFGEICVRQKSTEKIELGELLVADTVSGKIILQVYDLLYGSQISQQNLELISGLKLEEDESSEFHDANLRNYNLSYIKPMITISNNSAKLCKQLPNFFSEVRAITKDDLSFLKKPDDSIFVGYLRSGTEVLTDVPVYLPGREVFSHHILIPATTGKGKSNMLSVMLWDIVNKDYCGILVLDPHDEYFGRNKLGLKDHPQSDKIVYYTPNSPPPGTMSLKINIKNIKPYHFNGCVNFSDPQIQALQAYSRAYGKDWIDALLNDKVLPSTSQFFEATIAVVKRVIASLLNLDVGPSGIFSKSIFEVDSGETTVKDICNELENGNTVIIDTSSFSGSVEILIGSLISTEIFSRYKYHKVKGTLDSKPVISIILEEAPRVLGKDVLDKGSNIFSTIAREGRKFKIGLTAITQLPSLIPRQILANMNTKIVLGIEMAPERQAIIDSASQDLSTDNRNIASLDKGEAIITSNFTRFAMPIKIPLFEDFARKNGKKDLNITNNFSGIDLG